jgi:hypothetical protein
MAGSGAAPSYVCAAAAARLNRLLISMKASVTGINSKVDARK